jgi:hypothetical protein
MLSRASYRTAQVRRYLLTPSFTAADQALVDALLPPPLAALFARQRPSDQVHAVAVCRDLQAAGYHDPILLQAALLHDVGKSAGLPLLARVVVVALAKLTPGLLARLVGPAEPWVARLAGSATPALPGESHLAGLGQMVRRPLAVSIHHPAIGAALAAQAGADPAVVALIRAHQDAHLAEPTLLPLLRALQSVDDAH